MADAASHEFNAADDATFLSLASSAARVGVAGHGLGVAELLGAEAGAHRAVDAQLLGEGSGVDSSAPSRP